MFLTIKIKIAVSMMYTGTLYTTDVFKNRLLYYLGEARVATNSQPLVTKSMVTYTWNTSWVPGKYLQWSTLVPRLNFTLIALSVT